MRRALAPSVLLFWATIAPSVADTTTNVRILQPYGSVTYNIHALDTFKTLFHTEACSALGVDPSRLIVSLVTEDSEIGGDPVLDELGSKEVDRPPYKGSTTLVHVQITDGTPSSTEIYDTMWEQVSNQGSQWYQGEITGRTDPGQIPKNHQDHSNNDGKHGNVSMPLIFPLGFAPLSLMLLMYLGMAGGSKRKAVVGDQGVKDEESRLKQKAQYKADKLKKKEDKAARKAADKLAGRD